jgi:hypothetical protein
MRDCTTDAPMSARACGCGFGRTRFRAETVRDLSVGSQAFYYATAFNQDISSWNVIRVNAAGWASTWTSATALSGCTALAIYTAWGSTFQGVWPTFSRACTVGSVPCAVCITNGNVAAAVTEWIGGDATTYGNIVEWNTAAVTSMANLLYPSNTARPTFNADISKWNVASVSNMYRVRSYSRWVVVAKRL